MNWNYQHTEDEYNQIPAGRYRVRIEEAEMTVSKAGNDMLKLTLEVNGYKSHLWHYIVFLADRPEITNRMLTQFFDAFDIPEGDFNIAGYVGKTGGANVKIDDDGRSKISYFLKRKQLDELPPWQDGDEGFAPVGDGDGDLPFDLF